MGGGFRGRKLTVGNMISRRNFLKLTGGAVGAASVGLLAACREKAIIVGEAGEASEGQQEAGSAASQGRLLAGLPACRRARRPARAFGHSGSAPGATVSSTSPRATGQSMMRRRWP